MTWRTNMKMWRQPRSWKTSSTPRKNVTGSCSRPAAPATAPGIRYGKGPGRTGPFLLAPSTRGGGFLDRRIEPSQPADFTGGECAQGLDVLANLLRRRYRPGKAAIDQAVAGLAQMVVVDRPVLHRELQDF